MLAPEKNATLPVEAVVVFGISASLIVAIPYLPARRELRKRGGELVTALFPATDPVDGSSVLKMVENRQRMQELLGIEENLLSELQGSFLIVAPLIVGAVDLFIVITSA